jgi:hypothetical protein
MSALEVLALACAWLSALGCLLLALDATGNLAYEDEDDES